MPIKVSVLVYVRNDRKHIQECMESVITQTLKEIEILAIDGGSTDGTLEFLEEMAERDPRIRVFHAIPSVGAQFNLGLREAKGEYIGICESDDYILPDMYEIQYHLAKENQLDILRADFNRFCGDKEDRTVLPFRVLDGESLYGKVLRPKDNDYMVKMGITSFWSGLYRREFLLQGRIFMNETRGASYQDTSFAFMSLYKAERVMIFREAFYCYRWDNPNSSVNMPQKTGTLIEEYNLLKERLQKENLFEASKEYYFSWKINAYIWYYTILPTDLKKAYISQMFSELRRDLESGQYQGNKLGKGEREAIQKVELSDKNLEEYLRGKEQRLLETRERLNQLRESDEIIIFGNGNMGKLVRKFLQRRNVDITAYMDNNKKLWGQTEGNIPVVAPGDGIGKFADAVYIVANVNYYKEIEHQLLSLGIPKEKTITCSDYESLLF